MWRTPAHCVCNANDLVFVSMQLLASGPSADKSWLADGRTAPALCVCNANDLVSVAVQLLASGPSADIFRLADGQVVVAFAPPLYVSTAGVVYLDTSQLGKQILQQT